MSDIVAYAAHQIIKKFANPSNGEVDGLWFNKIITILNYRLKLENGKDIKLPHYWYFWGNKVELGHMPSELRRTSPDEDGKKSGFKWVGPNPEEPPLSDRKLVRHVIDSIYSRFPNTNEGRLSILNANYAYAPYEFQRAYAAFRTDMYEIVDVQLAGLKREFLRADLEKAMKLFPYRDFPDLTVSAMVIKILGDALLSEEKDRIAKEITKEFWETFCKRLRIIKGVGNENIPENIISYWKNDAIEHINAYEKKLKTDVESILETESLKKIKENPILYTFLNPEDWGEGTEDSSIIMTYEN